MFNKFIFFLLANFVFKNAFSEEDPDPWDQKIADPEHDWFLSKGGTIV